MADTQSQVTGRNVVAYLGKNGCDCSQSLASVVLEFQKSYNLDVVGHIYNGPQLEVDGKYGNDTEDAMGEVFGSAVPKACYSAGNPCFGKGIIPGGKPIPAGTIIVPPGPPTAGGGGTTTNGTTVAATPSNFTAWLVVGAVAVAAAAGAVYYTKQKQQRAAPISSRTTRNMSTKRIAYRR